MAIKHNQQIPNNHFRKQWQRRVRVHFDQPARKLRRRNARLAKATAVAPRPVDRLRPVVRAPTIKYNRHVRAGRGFTPTELKEAGIAIKFAPTIGIAVDTRRVNLSEEGLKVNVERLKAYLEKLILFPRRVNKPNGLDSKKEDIKAYEDGKTPGKTAFKLALPINNPATPKAVYSERKIEKGAADKSVYAQLRKARSDARLVGVRQKRAKAKEEEAANAKK